MLTQAKIFLFSKNKRGAPFLPHPKYCLHKQTSKQLGWGVYVGGGGMSIKGARRGLGLAIAVIVLKELILSVMVTRSFLFSSWVGVGGGPGANARGVHSVTVDQTTLPVWPAWTACVGESVPGQAFHTSGHSILHSWKGPSLNRNVDGFVMSYLLICSWRFSFLLQVLSFPSLFVY